VPPIIRLGRLPLGLPDPLKIVVYPPLSFFGVQYTHTRGLFLLLCGFTRHSRISPFLPQHSDVAVVQGRHMLRCTSTHDASKIRSIENALHVTRVSIKIDASVAADVPGLIAKVGCHCCYTAVSSPHPPSVRHSYSMWRGHGPSTFAVIVDGGDLDYYMTVTGTQSRRFVWIGAQ